jgi:hypothetical protein
MTNDLIENPLTENPMNHLETLITTYFSLFKSYSAFSLVFTDPPPPSHHHPNPLFQDVATVNRWCDRALYGIASSPVVRRNLSLSWTAF